MHERIAAERAGVAAEHASARVCPECGEAIGA